MNTKTKIFFAIFIIAFSVKLYSQNDTNFIVRDFEVPLGSELELITHTCPE